MSGVHSVFSKSGLKIIRRRELGGDRNDMQPRTRRIER